MLQPKKKKQPPISSSLKTGIDFIHNTSKAIGKSKVAKNIVPMGPFFGLFDSFINDHPYEFSDMVGVVPTQATQIASLVLDYAEKEKENLKEFATKKMQGKDISKIKPREEELNLTTKSTIPSTPNLAFGTGKDGLMKAKMNPRKKYAAGTAAITPNGIPSPATTLNDYQIMMAKAEEEAASNAWLPVVATVGGLAQSAIGLLQPGTGTKDANAVKAANGMNNVNADVEVEGGEMYETPQGETGEFQGPSHEQGGIPMEVNQDIPEGTKVYSDRLKVGKETLAERKANRERQIANLEKVASQPLIDSAVKNATKRKMEAIQKEEIADLQFQEQVNNMQQMADTIVKAFGTSMAGVQANPIGDSMRYGMGTGADGVTEYEKGTGPGGIKYGTGYTEEDFKPYIDAYMSSTPDTPFNLGDFQKTLGMDSKVNNFGKIAGPSTFALAQQRYGENPNALDITGLMNNTKTWGQEAFANAPTQVNPMDAVTEAKPFETSNLNLSEALKSETTASPGVNLPGTKLSRAMGKLEGMPGLGDLTGLFGNYLSATAGLQNAAEQRSTDVTHQNVFANAGKQSQNYLEKAIGNVEAMKSAAEMKATTGARSSKASAGSGAKSISQKRSMNWLYDQGLADSIASISANAAAQVAGIRDKQAGIALSADQLSGEGQFKANMANEAAKDAYYTARGLGLKDQSMAVQQTGKDLNAMKQNKIIENLMKQYGTYVMANSKGDIQNKPTK